MKDYDMFSHDVYMTRKLVELDKRLEMRQNRKLRTTL